MLCTERQPNDSMISPFLQTVRSWIGQCDSKRISLNKEYSIITCLRKLWQRLAGKAANMGVEDTLNRKKNSKHQHLKIKPIRVLRISFQGLLSYSLYAILEP